MLLQQLDTFSPAAFSLPTVGGGPSSQDQVTAFMHCRVTRTHLDTFTVWLDGILAAAAAFRPAAWRGRMVLGPTASTDGQDDFIIMFRFAEYGTMRAWLLSPERARCTC